MIRALVFDFDGLILDTETALIDAYAEVHRARGVPFDREVFQRGAGHASYAFDPWRAFAGRADRAALEPELHRLNREFSTRLPLLPGVVPLLDAARTAGLPLGLASNSSRTHVEGHLRRLGLFERFAFLACRGEAPSPKPEPDLYRLVLTHLGRRGSEAIAFEDSQTGVLAAKRAGLWTVAVPGPTTAGQDFSLADLRLSSLADTTLKALLDRFTAI